MEEPGMKLMEFIVGISRIWYLKGVTPSTLSLSILYRKVMLDFSHFLF